MLLPADRRRLLGAFLRSHREALTPGTAGLPAAGRRRTPGLRREEVADLGGVSTAWYTWAEQGRDIAFSESALARLAKALQLTVAERAYLFELTRRRDPAPPKDGHPPEAAPTELVLALQAIAAPAYLLDRLWHVCGANAAAQHLFSPWLSSGEGNLLRYVFLDPGAPAFIRDWDERARRLLAEFRADTAQDSGDPGFRALVSDLQGRSPAFLQIWNSHEVLAREGGNRVFDHPTDGLLACTQITLVPASHPGHKLVMLLPRGSDASRLGTS